MPDLRYVIGVLVVVSFPPVVGYWLVVHPLIRFWRQVGPHTALTVVTVLVLGAMTSLFLLRDAVIGRDLGASGALTLVGLLAMAVALWIGARRRHHLDGLVLAGVPELDASGRGGSLVTTGPYAHIRHPRYVEGVLGLLGAALIANWTGPYLVVAAGTVALHLVVLLEERELRQRFGGAYEAYAARVPRYLPRPGGPPYAGEDRS